VTETSFEYFKTDILHTTNETPGDREENWHVEQAKTGSVHQNMFNKHEESK
jgi:hypothetical protein